MDPGELKGDHTGSEGEEDLANTPDGFTDPHPHHRVLDILVVPTEGIPSLLSVRPSGLQKEEGMEGRGFPVFIWQTD